MGCAVAACLIVRARDRQQAPRIPYRPIARGNPAFRGNAGEPLERPNMAYATINPYTAQSARSCDFGHLGEHVGNGLVVVDDRPCERSEEHTSELQSLMRISYAVFCLKKKKKHKITTS